MQDRSLVVCAVCGAENVVAAAPVDTQANEPPDFDTRPGEPLRSTIANWVQNCGACGYCSDDITRAAPEAARIAASEGYRTLLSQDEVPEKARHFLCFSWLLEKLHRPADAGWSALHAAWICDDTGAEDAAVRCRRRAIELWQRGKTFGQLFCDDMASEFALVTDVYRRTGLFEHAAVACAEGLDVEDIPPAVEAMLRRQSVLIHRRDRAAHSMRELLQ